MQLLPTTLVLLCAMGASVTARKVPVEDKGVHHSMKKQLKGPLRLPRKSEVADSSDFNPALAYAAPPAGLSLHQGQGFGYGATQGQEVQGQGFGYGASQGQEAAALAALVSAGLQSHQGLVSPKKPVYHFTPIEPYRLVSPAAIPIDEPKQEAYEHAAVEQHEVPLAQAVHAEAHSFVDTPHNHLYKHEEHEDEYKDYASKYQFGYRVRDLHTGNDFGQTESRDGHLTQGHYHVLLPDGRLQNVQYWSDDTGFHAKVSYDGHATHH